MSYRRNYLTQVIFQATYNSVERLKTSIDDVLVQVCQEITGAAKNEGKNTIINVVNNKVSNELSSIWIFNGTTIQVAVQPTMFQIITKRYEDHNQFHSMIVRVCEIIIRTYGALVSKASLRYINTIAFSSGNTFDFNGLIDNDLLKSILKFTDKRPSRSMGNMVLTQSDYNITTIFNYGFFNSQFPNLIAKREFVLDYDCQCVMTEQDNLSQILLQLRNNANDLFESSIADGLRSQMNSPN